MRAGTRIGWSALALVLAAAAGYAWGRRDAGSSQPTPALACALDPRLADPIPGAQGPPPAQRQPAPASSPAGGGLAVLPAPSTGAPPEVHARAAAEARVAVERLHGVFVSRCIDELRPALARPSVPITFVIGYDAGGRAIARSVFAAVRGEAESAVADCVRRLDGPFDVSPPGTNVGVELTIDLP